MSPDKTVPSWLQWYAVATAEERELHEVGRRVRGLLDEGTHGDLTQRERDALAVYDAQQAGEWPASTGERP